jgi:hypothetical protein
VYKLEKKRAGTDMQVTSEFPPPPRFLRNIVTAIRRVRYIPTPVALYTKIIIPDGFKLKGHNQVVVCVDMYLVKTRVSIVQSNTGTSVATSTTCLAVNGRKLIQQNARLSQHN